MLQSGERGHGRLSSWYGHPLQLAVTFPIVSALWQSNSSEILREIRSWWRSFRRHRPEDFGTFNLASPPPPPNGRLPPAVSEQGGFSKWPFDAQKPFNYVSP
jgi:hypothetical protein